MNERDFCYWLHGLFELGDPEVLNKKQTGLIKRHLEFVFDNVTEDNDENDIEDIYPNMSCSNGYAPVSTSRSNRRFC